MIRVLVADDHPEVRLVLELLLKLVPDIDLVGEAVNGQEALEAVNGLQPDVLVMDVHMPALDGWKATKQLVELGVSTRVILISLETGEYMSRRAAEAGAQGFVSKDDVAADLVPAIRAVHRGETYFVK